MAAQLNSNNHTIVMISSVDFGFYMHPTLLINWKRPQVCLLHLIRSLLASISDLCGGRPKALLALTSSSSLTSLDS